MATAATNRGPPDETITRITKGGRKLTYWLTVIQQPERARACGSGAKSSADRRPVDPPPVVELRIFEGEGLDRNDITFAYDGNFFLFATLEMARPIAHGRVPPTPTQVPVLTGMPVSGMAYLDRPTEAGYFIFPDLSVRHEGVYRLSFNLYEETKLPADLDAEPANDKNRPKVPSGANAPDKSFDWRLEVKSNFFTVYSAKKFPGLTESTVLSRTVAEQGCRVRIRRDVRMRRREGKPNGEDYEEEDYVRAGRAPTTEPYRERSRSLSNEGDGRQPYTEQRRLSGDYDYTHTPGAPPPPGHQQGGHLSWLSHSGPQAPPQPSFTQSQPPAPAPSYQPAPGPYHHQNPDYRGPAPPPPGNYGYDRQPYPQSAYPTNPPRERGFEPDYRRASVAGYAPSSAPHSSQYPAVESNYSRNPHYHGYAPCSPGPVNLAPLKMPMESKCESLSTPPGPLTSVSRTAPPLHSPTNERTQDRPSSFSKYPATLPPPTDAARNGKRTYDSVFSSTASNQPLYNGMRPSSSHNNEGMFDDDDQDISLEQLKMQYKRADGTSFSRELPVVD